MKRALIRSLILVMAIGVLSMPAFAATEKKAADKATEPADASAPQVIAPPESASDLPMSEEPADKNTPPDEQAPPPEPKSEAAPVDENPPAKEEAAPADDNSQDAEAEQAPTHADSADTASTTNPAAEPVPVANPGPASPSVEPAKPAVEAPKVAPKSKAKAEPKTASLPVQAVEPKKENLAPPTVMMSSAPAEDVDVSSGVTIEKVSVDDAGNRLLVLIQTSKPVECFVFERHDPPSLYIQFIGTTVFAGGEPIQVVGIDPLAEVRYGYSSFHDASAANRDMTKKYPLEYLELKLNRSVFYHVQQEGWVVVVGLDKTTAKVEIPDLDFRFEKAKYEGAANLPLNPRDYDFVSVAQANSRLLSVARDEADLAKFRVWESRR
ncbi:MAG: hypothetical protein JO102_04210, partial [Elusimicrobia bacterium]|nr:hypothetical protein [Elusimicrobiota bacterium]